MAKTKPVYKTAKNASNLHKRIGELLTCSDSPYRFYEIRQEYPVKKINPEYRSGREKFDYVILGLNIVLEIHGKQHEAPVCFGGMMSNEAQDKFEQQQKRDRLKKQAALDAGWKYLVVWYHEKDITMSKLFERIQQLF